jgi:hypothetical protein
MKQKNNISFYDFSMKKQKIDNEEPCDTLSHLDCGDCIPVSDIRIGKCSAQCTRNRKVCTRRSFSSNVEFCLQHFMRILEKKIPWPTHIVTRDKKLSMIQEVIKSVKNTARRKPKDRDRLVRELYVYAKKYGLSGLDTLDTQFFDGAISSFLTSSEKIDTKLSRDGDLTYSEEQRHTEDAVNILLQEFGHPSIHILKDDGRWIDDRKIPVEHIYNVQKPVYIWCHDIDITERIVESLSIHHVIVVGTFTNFIRNGIVNNNNIFSQSIIQSVVYLLPWVQNIGNEWMSECELLVNADFTGLNSLKHVGNNWLSDCESLQNPNFLGLWNLLNVGHNWMSSCTSILTLDFTGLKNLQSVDDFWLFACTHLVNPKFTGLTSLNRVGNVWMADCVSLTDPNFTGLNSLKRIGHTWLYSCTSLTNPCFIGLTGLLEIGDEWMSRCSTLVNPDFKGLYSLKSVGNYWMSHCDLLENLNFTYLIGLEKVGTNWVSDCRSLVRPVFTGLINLIEVSYFWMANCISLVDPIFIGLNSLVRVGDVWIYRNITLLNPNQHIILM